MRRLSSSYVIKLKVCIALVIIFLPYILVLVFGKEKADTGYRYDSVHAVVMDNEAVDLEKFIIRVLAAYISPESSQESLKAMAVVLRTNIVKAMNWEERIAAGSLNVEYLTEKEMEEYWGEENFVEYYRKLEAAVNATKGNVIVDKKAKCIDALFHRISAGYTRDGSSLGSEYTYLKAVASTTDIEAEGYMQLVTYPAEMVKKLLYKNAGISIDYDEKGLPLSELITINKKNGDYAEWISICGVSLSAKQFCTALGLKSPAFTFEDYDGKIRFLVTGEGHGYGLSICGAENLAGKGYDYKEIIKYYYTSDVIIKHIG